MAQTDSFKSLSSLKIGPKSYSYFRLKALVEATVGTVEKLPFSLKILLENLLRQEDGVSVTKNDIQGVASWKPSSKQSENEIAFMPARVVLQDFTGVPCIVDLASLRDAVVDMGGTSHQINPLQPVDLVIDHSVQVDVFGGADSFKKNVEIEYQRNQERYSFLRWGQKAFQNFRVVPPGTGIVHQVNLEYLGQVVCINKATNMLYPDTVIGTDSHTTMINGLGILGWGVGGIEAEAAMLGQSVTMLIPDVVGFKLHGKLPEGTTATDLVLTITQMLRKKGVVGKFVEFFGQGLTNLTLPDRATIANMAPEYGATMGFFPVDEETLTYLQLTGRDPEDVSVVKAYCIEQGLFRTDQTPDPIFSDWLELDLSTVQSSVAGPKRPQDRVNLGDTKQSFEEALPTLSHRHSRTSQSGISAFAKATADKQFSALSGLPAEALAKAGSPITNFGDDDLRDGSVVIAAITSCTNTSNPSVLIEAGLLAKKACERGLKTKPWVKTSLAPGSKVVTDYLNDSGLSEPLEKLGFYLVGYGCTTCIGNSGPLSIEIEKTVKEKELVVASVLSGNRNFEGRIHPLVRANYLMSPPLVVAYALAGSVDVDISTEPLGIGKDGKPVYLKDVWPKREDVQRAIHQYVKNDLYKKQYSKVFEGDEEWRKIPIPEGGQYVWDNNSTYIRRASFLERIPKEPAAVKNIRKARVLALLGDSVTTDHISPAGSISESSPAGQYLVAHRVSKANFNSYGARRGNHEVMVRGTFANVRLKNQLAPGTEGGFTTKFPEGQPTTIFDAAMAYQKEGTPLVVLAGKEYGSGSSRDWAAKGVMMLGVKAVIAESYERIHRSNLVMMGVLPLQYQTGETAASLGLTGKEIFEIVGLESGLKPRQEISVKVTLDGKMREFKVLSRIDTPKEIEYYTEGGILPYVLRQILKNS